jgi:putative SOS response-associated peptidase YedK
MCGRFTLRTTGDVVADFFGLRELPDLPPRYNIAPTQTVPVVRLLPGRRDRELALLHWGLVPAWAGDPAIGHRLINARADTASEKPAFRGPFRHRRCLVMADGFYEWQKQGSRKQPFYIRRQDDRPFALAGLWDHWDRGEEPFDTCTILTTEANDILSPIHDRMPVILDPADYALWLDPAVHDPRRLERLLKTRPTDDLLAYPIRPLVNSTANDGPACIEPAASECT